MWPANTKELPTPALDYREHSHETTFTFTRFGLAKFPDGGSVLGSSQFTVQPQLTPKIMLGLKEVKIDSKISNLLC
jgi:hypothetical protein